MIKKHSFLLALSICLLAASCGPGLVVDSAGDSPDINPGDGNCITAENHCTLRAALMEADADANVSNITFDAPMTISPNTNLPSLTSNNTKIKGEGQAIILDGSQNPDTSSYGLHIFNSSRNVIQGIQIQNFLHGIIIEANGGTADKNTIGLLATETGDLSQANVLIHNKTGVLITGANAFENIIAGNYIGISANGLKPKPNEFNGVSMNLGAHHNLIGSLSGTSLQEGGNLISGNDGTGVWISHGEDNQISGNYIGTNAAGLSSVGNHIGIRITHGSTNNVIGLNVNGDGIPNLISGNETFGIAISESSNSNISGNFIGTNIHGTQSIPNLRGIWLENGSMQNTIGTNGDGNNDQEEGNLISGNSQHGIYINENCVTNFISGNLIGTTADGLSPLGNGWSGISVHGDDNRIGTDGDQTSDAIEANVIADSGTTGITSSSNYNVIAGNMIGVGIDGSTAIGNAHNGIVVHGYDNIIGTDGDGNSDASERNIVSGNGKQDQGGGIIIYGNDNIIAGNYVGTDFSGTVSLGNETVGISLQSGASGNLVGTNGDGTSDLNELNLISGNGRQGLNIISASTNTVAGNFIGTDITGTIPLPNGHSASQSYGAISIGPGSSLNIIGTNGNGQQDEIEGNLISGNELVGIKFVGTNNNNNVIAGNIIGLDISGSSILGNLGGISMPSGSDNILVGTNADGIGDVHESNLIGGNQSYGILIGGSNIQVSGNAIGTNLFGTSDFGNGGPGINVVEPATDILIGGSDEKSNIIAFNKFAGVIVSGANATNTRILNNSIHSNEKLGIDLNSNSGLYDVLINDPGDVDTGPNDLMNYPVLTKATSITGFVSISGDIVNSLPNTSYQVQFFSNGNCDSPSGHGEGKTYLGAHQVMTDMNGNGAFSTNFAASVPAGHYVTSTATAYGKTSEFSACVEVIASDESTYSGEGDPCDIFDQDRMEVTTFDIRPESNLFYLYLKNDTPYPGPGADDDWEYFAILGDRSADICKIEVSDDRLYCYFTIPESYFNSLQTLQVFSNICIPPFYINDISILFKDPQGDPDAPPPEGCHSGLGQRDCIAVGGNYNTETSTCFCPRSAD